VKDISSTRTYRRRPWLRAIALLLAASPFECSAPTYSDCTIACGPDASCPSGFSCSNGRCTAGEACKPRDAERVPRDASTLPDVRDAVSNGSGGRTSSGGAEGIAGSAGGNANQEPGSGGKHDPPDANTAAGGGAGGAAGAGSGGKNDGLDASRDATSDSSTKGDGALDGAAPPPKCDLTKPFGPPQPMAVISSDTDDTGFTLRADGLEAYFSSKRGLPQPAIQIFRTTRSSTALDFEPPVPLRTTPPVSEQDPYLSPDGRTLYYGSYSHIFASARGSLSEAFGAGTLIFGVYSTAGEADPFVAHDGRTLYFSSTRRGGYDIYSAPLVGGAFQNPVPVSSVNNTDTDQDEDAPVLSDDELTIYFGSNRTAFPSLPGYAHIWVAHRTARDADFGVATVVRELATNGLEYPEVLTDGECTLYFTGSPPPGTAYPYQMYRASKPPL
jgi:hypothetical protein